MRRDMTLQLQCANDAQFGQQVAELAEALVAINIWEIRHDEKMPCCLECGGVQYEPPQSCGILRGQVACQAIRDARGIYQAKRGTCLDLACERAARLRLSGVDAKVIVEQRRHYGTLVRGQYHAYVETPAGTEDPAAQLQAKHAGGHEGCGCVEGIR